MVELGARSGRCWIPVRMLSGQFARRPRSRQPRTSSSNGEVDEETSTQEDVDHHISRLRVNKQRRPVGSEGRVFQINRQLETSGQ